MIIKNNIYIDSNKYLHFPPCLYHIWCLNVFLVINNFFLKLVEEKNEDTYCVDTLWNFNFHTFVWALHITYRIRTILSYLLLFYAILLYGLSKNNLVACADGILATNIYSIKYIQCFNCIYVCIFFS